MVSVIMLNAVIQSVLFSYYNAECHYTECHYAESRGILSLKCHNKKVKICVRYTFD
jgi:hypothetical protein